jgi:hypothetical protein
METVARELTLTGWLIAPVGHNKKAPEYSGALKNVFSILEQLSCND